MESAGSGFGKEEMWSKQVCNKSYQLQRLSVSRHCGTLVSAVCFGGDVAFFETSLVPYKRYYISNAYVKPVKAGYEVGDYRYAWTLFSTTRVQPVDEVVPPPIPHDFQFKRFSDMFRYADRETPINIKGFIVEASPEKKVGRDSNGQLLTAQDFVVADTEKTPMVMRLWKEKIKEYSDVLSQDLPNGVMFVGMNIKVTTFNGLSLSSSPSTVLLKEPLINEAAALKEWYASSKKYVDDLLSSMAYKNMDILFKKPAAEDILPITDAIATIQTTKTAWIAGKLKLIEGQDKFWYMCCKNCQKSLRPGHRRDMLCSNCDEEDPICYKCHIGVYLKEAEEEGRLLTAELEAALENKHVVCYIKYFNKLVRGAITRKYPLVKIYLYSDVFSNAEPPTEDAKPNPIMLENETVDLTKDSEDDVQFFTPSTKMLIKQISRSSQDNNVEDASASASKDY